MKYLLNNSLTVGISPLGAELKSIQQNGHEHLWQADAAIWARTSPILFPVVGKPFNNELLIQQTPYVMPQHGFARDMEFEVLHQEDEKIVFGLTSTPETLKVYPYSFELRITYTLKNTNSVECMYEVHNTGNEPMCFGIGAHPGFNLPTQKLTDYVIEFEHPEEADRYLLTDGLLNGATEPCLQNANKLSLTSALFDKDALVFKHLKSNRISLKAKNSSFKIEIEWKDFPYLGIWSKKGCEQFICLEPWCGIAGSTGGQLPIENKEGMNKLAPKEVFTRSYTMAFTYIGANTASTQVKTANVEAIVLLYRS